MTKRALISVYDKTGIEEFAKLLLAQGYELISTGGTYQYLVNLGIPVCEVNTITGFPEILDGRVKTLHPIIHAGILAKRDNPAHLTTLAQHSIATIDLVVVNLYPFFSETVKEISLTEKIEFIDIGGPTMLRAAAKSFHDVTVVCDINDYPQVSEEMIKTGEVSFALRKQLAGKVFNLTSAYDAAISQVLLDNQKNHNFPEYLNLSYHKQTQLRYGENPHQSAAFYVATNKQGVMANFTQLNGKELSFNNLRDMDLAWKVVSEFEQIAACGVKHSTPCGVATGLTVPDAYQKMFACDSVSIFGGIVAINHEIDATTANLMQPTFLEIVMAPSFTDKALAILQTKKNLRVIQVKPTKPSHNYEYVTVDGGILMQNCDNQLTGELQVVTKTQPAPELIDDLLLALKVVKHVKSNAIVVAKGGAAVGIGAGQTNRIWATEQAIARAGEGGVLASDAFFPFRDCVDACARSKIQAIIQPGGSLRDQESIYACDEYGIMIFSGIRHFKH
jgi:phosphoribosylaminoimidazolecarboxamide formyltransferase/IMP cyclohydrolase